jgi:putative ATPase
MTQTVLFGEDRGSEPLASRMRPDSLDGYVGQQHLLGKGRFLRNAIENDRVPSMILWGPPGTGKTTLAHIIAGSTGAEFVELSAVTAGAEEIRKVMADAEARASKGKRTVLFIDEIHRFNKTQQDLFLPYVERGTVTLIGATTENPSFELNSALLSRCKVFVLEKLGEDDILALLKRAVNEGFPGKEVVCSDNQLRRIAVFADGDARSALNSLETAVALAGEGDRIEITDPVLDTVLGKRTVRYDRDGEEHYNIISAFHEGMRNTDPDAAVYWLARMLEGGEDPKYIARRLMEAAPETVGLADSTALELAAACYYACSELGERECELMLAETAIYMSMAPRTNGVPMALGHAYWDVHHSPGAPVPLHIRNAPTKLMKELDYGKGYQYAEDTEEKVTKMQCLPDVLKDRQYYNPGNKGDEIYYARRLKALRDWKAGKRKDPPR